MNYEPIEKVISTSINITKANALRKKIAIKPTFPRFLPDLVEIDKIRLGQVITNLITNAIKFSKENSTVELKILWNYNCLHPNTSCENCSELNDFFRKNSGRIRPDEIIPSEHEQIELPDFKYSPCKLGKTHIRVNSENSLLMSLEKYNVSKINRVGNNKNQKTDTSPSQTTATKIMQDESVKRLIFGNEAKKSSTIKNSAYRPKESRREILKKLGKSQMVLPNQQLKKEVIPRVGSNRVVNSKLVPGYDDNFVATNLENNNSLCKINKNLPNEGTLIVQVKDIGCGISEEDQKKLFQPYTQANKKVYSEHGGTGLGLWISKQLIQAMHGTIKCNSILGQGTNFEISIPVNCKAAIDKVFLYIIFEKEIKNTFNNVTIFMLKKKQTDLRTMLDAAGCAFIDCENINQLRAMFTEYSNNSQPAFILMGIKKSLELVRNFDLKALGITQFNLIILTAKPYSHIPELKQFCVFNRNSDINEICGGILNIVRAQKIWKNTCKAHENESYKISKKSIGKSEKKFILADDNDFVRTAIKRQLHATFKSCQVIDCSNGQMVFDEIQKSHCPEDYVLMDVNMPIMDGIEASRRIRNFEQANKLKKMTIIRIFKYLNTKVMSGDGNEYVSKLCQNININHICIFRSKIIMNHSIKTIANGRFRKSYYAKAKTHKFR